MDKPRACDDLKHSLTKLACSVSTPIQLGSWGHVAQLFPILFQKGGTACASRQTMKQPTNSCRLILPIGGMR